MKIESGLALHCHHDRLYEFVYSYQERVDYINKYKPEKERALRLRLFKMVPEAMVPGRESKAWAACEKAWDAYAEAWADYTKKYAGELAELHRQLCPDCPWDGKTIFTEKKEKK